MKRSLLLTCTFSVVFCMCLNAGFAQQTKKSTKPKPPLHMKVPPPPKLLPPPEVQRQLEADPLMEQDLIAFVSPKIYLKTDSAFIVQQKYFVPGIAGSARISINNYMYPARFTKDSIDVDGDRVPLANAVEMYFQDGQYRYDGKYPRQSAVLVFTDSQKPAQPISFKIIWKEKTGPKKSIVALEDLASKTRWEVGEAPAAPPSM